MTCGGIVRVYFEAFNVTRWNIVIFGAGHVANAVIDILKTLDCRITCIDPAPRASLRKLGVEHRQVLLRDADPGVFEALAAGDILFIDSSHIAMPGTDVDRLFLDVLPRLAGGTLVHIHDIALPYGYPKIWDWRGYNEQLLAGAFLQGGGYELAFASHYLARDRSDVRAMIDQAERIRAMVAEGMERAA